MPKITINGNEYFSYATVEQADIYLLPTPYNDAWSVLDEETKGGYLIQATRFLDSLPWKKKCGETQDERVLNDNIVYASIEIAARLASGETDIIGGGSTAGGVQTLKAGSAQISYFEKKTWRYGSGIANSIVGGLPQNILVMIQDCLAINNGTTIGVSESFGTCYPSTANQSWKIQNG